MSRRRKRSTVVPLFKGMPVPDAGMPSPEIVSLLEDWLGAARRGEMTCLAVVAISNGRAVNNYYTSAGHGVSPLIGGLVVLQHRITRDLQNEIDAEAHQTPPPPAS